ncbi:MAG: hemerythrin HHE cation-binding protein [Planctomycetota bacterium]|nr:MAG: hemerythrin HHE cation-binding protein [Planctomycetota bacterium]
MLFNLGDKPLADFTQPLEMMTDCHRRIEYFLDLLRKVERQCGGGALTDEGRRALHASLNYFADFAPRHTVDEEESLFPTLRRHTSPEARAVMAELERLEGDHRRCEELHASVDQLVRQWLAAGLLDAAERARLRLWLAELASLYAAHIELEERRVFAVARQLLTADEVRKIGDDMKQRRSLGAGRATVTSAAK